MERKEAIEKIKEAMPTLWKDTKEAIETLIPELKENKDEKIRKSLIKDFRNYYEMYDKSCGEPKWGSDCLLVKDILAWLEMRKGQNTLSTEETELNSLAFLEQMGYTCIPPGKEQKPAEWSEEDESNLQWIISCVKGTNVYTSQELAKELTEWLKNKLKSLRPQPHKWYIKKGHWYMCIVDKPEYGWTKGKVYQSPEDNRIETDYKGDLTNWPDSEPWFRPATRDEIPDSQSHWKPSEQEKGALRTAIHILTDERSFPKAAAHLQNILDAFEGKESRKDWKPSEEQIAELKKVSNGGTCVFNTEILRSLYNDLVENYKTNRL